MSEDRSWADGLTQHDFEREYMRRWPHADVIPLGTEWMNQKEPEYRMIDAPEAEKFENDGPPSDKEAPLEKKEPKQAKQYPCRGCGRVFSYPVARAGHERGCNAKLQKAKEAAA